MIQQLNREGSTIVLVTHEPEVASFCGRVVVFRDGQVLSDHVSEHPASAEEALKALPVDPLNLAASEDGHGPAAVDQASQPVSASR